MTLQFSSDLHARELRGEPRAVTRLMALVSLDGVNHSRMVVTNLSREGFRFESPVYFEPGSEVRLTVGTHLPMRAIVSNSKHGLHGCRFVQPLDEIFFAGLIADGPFASREPVIVPPPAVERWPGWLRIPLIAGLATSTWAALFHFI